MPTNNVNPMLRMTYTSEQRNNPTAEMWWDGLVNYGTTGVGQLAWKDLTPAEKTRLTDWFNQNKNTANIHDLAAGDLNNQIGNWFRQHPTEAAAYTGSSLSYDDAMKASWVDNSATEGMSYRRPTEGPSGNLWYDLQGLGANRGLGGLKAASALQQLYSIAPDLAEARGITRDIAFNSDIARQSAEQSREDAANRSFNRAGMMGALAMLAPWALALAPGAGANAMAGSMGLEGIGAAGGAGLGAGTGAAATSYPVDLSNPELLYSHGEILGPPSSLAPESLGGAAATGAGGGGIPSVVDGPVSGISPMEGAAEAGTYYNPVTGQTLPYGQVGSTAAPGFSMSQASGLSGLFQSLGLPSELSGILSPLLQGLGGSYLARNMAGNYRDAANNSLAMLWPGREYQQSTFWPAITQGTNTLRNMYF